MELRELLVGERKISDSAGMSEETARDILTLSGEDKDKLRRRMHLLFIAGLLASLIFFLLFINDMADNFFGGLCLGVSTGMMIVGVLMTGKRAAKLRSMKLGLLRKITGDSQP